MRKSTLPRSSQVGLTCLAALTMLLPTGSGRSSAMDDAAPSARVGGSVETVLELEAIDSDGKVMRRVHLIYPRARVRSC